VKLFKRFLLGVWFLLCFFHNLVSLRYKVYILGSKHGRWAILNDLSFSYQNSLSAGLGEDASFEIELINLYGGKVFFIDPTPRALAHFDLILDSLGSTKSTGYSSDGSQSTRSYDLSTINRDSLQILPFALSNEDGVKRFFLPLDKKNVSHSLFSRPNLNSSDDYIDVNSICFTSLINLTNLTKIDLIKLDIEGSEIEVLLDLIRSNISVNQILVEFDSFPSFSIRKNLDILNCHKLLIGSGYKLVKIIFPSNFTYIQSSAQ
jgi:FkbM family methyltransferase